jgi:cupin 2 domain-containing protein
MIAIDNLFRGVPDELADELVQRLPLQSSQLRLERIVSHGQATPPGQWYDQPAHEWVLLLAGSAGLRFEGDDRVHILKPGDYLDIPAHCRHRVEWTHPTVKTVWLAVHYPTQP